MNNNNNKQSISRKQKFKDLMRSRTTLDQALTIKQIYCEVYSDVIERFHLGNSNRDKAISSMKKYYNTVIHNSSSKKDCRTVDDYNYIINDVSKQIEWYDDGTGKGPFFYIEKVNYLKRLARKLKQNDDAFRWLSIVPVKRYEIDETTGKKKPPYKEFKYVNINATQTPDFLTEVNEIYEKRAERRIEKLEYMQQKMNTIRERTSTPEGNLGFDIEVLVDKWTNVCERVFLKDNNNKEINKIISELKKEGKLSSSSYTAAVATGKKEKKKIDYKRLKDILKKEVVNPQMILSIMMSDKNIMKKVGQEEEEEKKTILSKDLVFDHIMRKTAEESNTLDSGIIFNSVELKQKVRSILKDTIETMTTDR